MSNPFPFLSFLSPLSLTPVESRRSHSLSLPSPPAVRKTPLCFGDHAAAVRGGDKEKEEEEGEAEGNAVVAAAAAAAAEAEAEEESCAESTRAPPPSSATSTRSSLPVDDRALLLLLLGASTTSSAVPPASRSPVTGGGRGGFEEGAPPSASLAAASAPLSSLPPPSACGKDPELMRSELSTPLAHPPQEHPAVGGRGDERREARKAPCSLPVAPSVAALASVPVAVAPLRFPLGTREPGERGH